jgi:putative membrane protein
VSSSRFPRNGCWRCWRCAAAAVALLLPLAAPAQQPPRYAASAAAEARPLGAAQRLERHFLQLTAASLRLQAEASQLALARTNNPAVKELAKLLLARHKTAQPELLRLLAARGMAMPLAGNEHNKVLKQLSKLNGAKFDRLYVDDVVLRTLQADVANFDRMSTQAEDKVLKTWVDRQLPLLRAHLDRAGKALPGAPLRGQRAV